MGASRRVWASLAAALLFGVSCAGGEALGQAPTASDTAVSRHTVPLQVVDGPEGATLAFVPVTISGEGPFPFALDTGAARSTIDAEIAEQLGLEEVAPPTPITGVGGQQPSVSVRVTGWRIGDVALAEADILSTDLPDQGTPFAGLLGSDVLDDFGTITISYEREELELHPR